MRKVNGLAIHQWATSNDALDAAFLALLNRLVGDTALTKRAVQPHLAHAALATLPYQLNRDTRVRCNQDPVEHARNRTKIGITPRALNLGCFRVDREHLEPGVSQLTMNGVSRLPRLP